jgi:SGNH domain (fused to AT3 domains)
MYIARIKKLLGGDSPTGRGAVLVTAGGVPPLPDIDNALKKNCPYLIPSFHQILASDSRVDRVVIVALWSQYFFKGYGYLYKGEPLARADVQNKALDAFRQMIRELVASGKTVTVVLDIPFGERFDPKGLLGRDFFGRCRQTADAPSKEEYLGEYGSLRGRIALAARSAGANVIDPLDALCDGDRCMIVDAEGPIRFDQGHLRPGFVREKATWIDDAIRPVPRP